MGLAQAGEFAAVPDFVVIPENWFRAAASTQLELIAAELPGWDSASARSNGAARLLVTVDFKAAMRETRSAAVHEHLPGATRLAVRSSALDEDGRHASRAGLYTSMLDVSPCALNHAVIECWRSWFSIRAQAHRPHAGWRPPQMAVGDSAHGRFASRWNRGRVPRHGRGRKHRQSRNRTSGWHRRTRSPQLHPYPPNAATAPGARRTHSLTSATAARRR